jgi:hypothetical protein
LVECEFASYCRQIFIFTPVEKRRDFQT